MNNYEGTKHKLEKLWEEIERDEIAIDKLEKLGINYRSIYYVKNKNKYILKDSSSNYFTETDYFFIIKLNNFPEEMLSNIKLITVFSICPYCQNQWSILQRNIIKYGLTTISYYFLCAISLYDSKGKIYLYIDNPN